MLQNADFPAMPLPLEVSVIEARDLLAAGGVRLVDVREPDEFKICRMSGAELLPLTTFAEEGRAKLAGSSERILVVCHHGMRSLRAAKFLRELGCDNAQSIAGGIEAWSVEIDPNVPRY